MRDAAAIVLSLAATLAVYAVARAFQRRIGSVVLHPVLVSIVVLIVALRMLGIQYEDYDRGGRVLTFLLGPAVVALGLPLFRQMEEIGRKRSAVLLTLVAGSAAGALTATVAAALLGAPDEVIRSLIPRSVTTPIAIGIAGRVGGLAALSAAVSILTGVLGAVIGPPLLRALGINSRTAFGLALGAAAHGVGTARAAEEGDAEAASAGLAIGLMGVFTAVLAPLVVVVLLRIGWLE
ncbi:MAG TPA: LrgB family protein [Longimicrobium sp.]|jgi:predicted murein hydrolase (TIGR00659 family)|uniref:LrgB family protein n=1 Tax=Longimicrobium sp. TaxID=2029185 RepID=UPI002ED813EA